MQARLLLIALSLCTFASNSYGQTDQFEASGKWSSFYLSIEATWASSVQSDKSADGFFAIRFDDSRACKAQVSYSTPSPPAHLRKPDGPLNSVLELRIDGNDPWVVKSGSATVMNGLSVDGTRAIYNLSFFVPLEFVVELTNGNYLRMLDRGNEATERFSLIGSKVALSRAYSRCKDQEKLKASPPQTPSPQVPQPPRQRAPTTPERSI